MTTYIYHSEVLPELDTENAFYDDVDYAFSGASGSGDSLTELKTNTLVEFDDVNKTNGLVFNDDGSVSQQEYSHVTSVTEAVFGMEAVLTDTEMNKTSLDTSDFIRIIDYDNGSPSLGAGRIVRVVNGDDGQDVNIAASTGVYLTSKQDDGVSFDSTTSDIKRTTVIMHYSGPNSTCDIYIDGLLVETFSSASHTQAIISELRLGVGSDTGKLYSHVCLFRANNSFSENEVQEIVSNPYQLFKQMVNDTPEYMLDFFDGKKYVDLSTMAPLKQSTVEFAIYPDATIGTECYFMRLFDIQVSIFSNGAITATGVRGSTTTGSVFGYGNVYDGSKIEVKVQIKNGSSGYRTIYMWINGVYIGDSYSNQSTINSSITDLESAHATSSIGADSLVNTAGFEYIGRLEYLKVYGTDTDGVDQSYFFEFNQTKGRFIQDHISGTSIELSDSFPVSSGHVRAWGIGDGLSIDGTSQYISMDAITAAGNFEYSGAFTPLSATDGGIFLGNTLSNYNWFGIYSGALTLRASPTYFKTLVVLPTDNIEYIWRLNRVGSSIDWSLSNSAGWSASGTTVSGADDLTFDIIGRYATSPSFGFVGSQRYIAFGNDRYYDFTKISSDSLVVPDTISGKDATMVNWSDNGVFVPEKTKTLISQEFDGSTLVQLPNLFILNMGEVATIVGTLGTDSGQENILGESGGLTFSCAFLDAGILVRVGDDTDNVLLADNYTRPSKGEEYTLTITRVASGYNISINGIFIGQKLNYSSSVMSFKLIGGNNSAFISDGGTFVSFEITNQVALDFTTYVGDYTILDTSGNDQHAIVVGGKLNEIYDWTGYGEIVGYLFNGSVLAATDGLTLDDDFSVTFNVSFDDDIDLTSTFNPIELQSSQFIGSVNGKFYTNFGGTTYTLPTTHKFNVPYQITLERVGGNVTLSANGESVSYTSSIPLVLVQIGDAANTKPFTMYDKYIVVDGTVQLAEYDFTYGETSAMVSSTWFNYVLDTTSGIYDGKIEGGITTNDSGATFDGVSGSYIEIPQVDISASENFSITINAQATTQTNHNRWFGNALDSSINNQAITLNTLVETRLYMDDDTQLTFIHVALTANVIYEFVYARADGNNVTLHINGSLVGTVASSVGIKLKYIGTNSGLSYDGLYESFDANGSLFDLSASKEFIDGGTIQPVIIDHARARHATISKSTISGFNPVFEREIATVGNKGDYLTLDSAIAAYNNPTYDREVQFKVLNDITVGSSGTTTIENVSPVTLRMIISSYDVDNYTTYSTWASTGLRQYKLLGDNLNLEIRNINMKRIRVYSGIGAPTNVTLNYNNVHIDGDYALNYPFINTTLFSNKTIVITKSLIKNYTFALLSSGRIDLIDSVVIDCCGENSPFSTNINGYAYCNNVISHTTINRYNYGVTSPLQLSSDITGNNLVTSDVSATTYGVGTGSVDMSEWFNNVAMNDYTFTPTAQTALESMTFIGEDNFVWNYHIVLPNVDISQTLRVNWSKSIYVPLTSPLNISWTKDATTFITQNISNIWSKYTGHILNIAIAWSKYKTETQYQTVNWSKNQTVTNSIGALWSKSKLVETINHVEWTKDATDYINQNNHVMWSKNKVIDKTMNLSWSKSAEYPFILNYTTSWTKLIGAEQHIHSDWSKSKYISKNNAASWSKSIYVANTSVVSWSKLNYLTQTQAQLWSKYRSITKTINHPWAKSGESLVQSLSVSWGKSKKTSVSFVVAFSKNITLSSSISMAWAKHKNLSTTHIDEWSKSSLIVSTINNVWSKWGTIQKVLSVSWYKGAQSSLSISIDVTWSKVRFTNSNMVHAWIKDASHSISTSLSPSWAKYKFTSLTNAPNWEKYKFIQTTHTDRWTKDNYVPINKSANVSWEKLKYATASINTQWSKFGIPVQHVISLNMRWTKHSFLITSTTVTWSKITENVAPISRTVVIPSQSRLISIDKYGTVTIS